MTELGGRFFNSSFVELNTPKSVIQRSENNKIS